MKFKINFKLQEIDCIIPWGEKNKYLSWFGLTDGFLWIDIGNDVVYEYSQAARDYWKCNALKYNDYQLSRFLEDFSGIFYFVRESVPEMLYNHIDDFITMTECWKDKYIDEPDDLFNDFYDYKYMPLTEWFYNRTFDSGHLVGGPIIGCFRCGDKVKLFWLSDYVLDNKCSIWTSPKGVVEFNYADFVMETENFFQSFFIEMDKQVSLAQSRNWDKVEVDKRKLVLENQKRKADFTQKVNLLSCRSNVLTDWEKIKLLFEEMKIEIS